MHGDADLGTATKHQTSSWTQTSTSEVVDVRVQLRVQQAVLSPATPFLLLGRLTSRLADSVVAAGFPGAASASGRAGV